MSSLLSSGASGGKALIGAAAGGAFLLPVVKHSFETIDVNERGLRRRRGQLVRGRDFAWGFQKGDLYGKLEPGLAFAPFLHSILKFDMTLQTEENETDKKLELTCKDGKVTHGLQFQWARIDEDWMLYRSHTSYKTEKDMRQAFDGSVKAALGATAAGMNMLELYSEKDALSESLIVQTQPAFEAAGCKLHQVSLNQITFGEAQIQSNGIREGIAEALATILRGQIPRQMEEPTGLHIVPPTTA